LPTAARVGSNNSDPAENNREAHPDPGKHPAHGKPVLKTKRYGSGDSFKRIHLVAPKQANNFWSLQGAVELLGSKTLMPNSALATLMALTPADVNIEYVLTNENISPLDWDLPADLVAITGTTCHGARIKELCLGFRQRGLPIALGGPYASLNSEECRDLADHLFIGEAEYTWPKFLHDWTSGQGAPCYRQDGQVDLMTSPAPDWSLVRAADYMVMNVQTSRGCPHQCDFCDVIRFIGRKFRTKSVDQILTEVKNVHAAGGRTVFFSDDNFVGNKEFTKALLTRVYEWNSIQERPLSFSTQMTVDVADDEELLQLMAQNRLSVAFIGVETVRAESLKEVHKSHNLKRDNRDRLRVISKYGIVPFVGLVVGFDHDDQAIFDEIYQFVEDTNCPVVSLSLLNAPKGTPLFERLEQQGRLVGEDWAGEWHADTNIIPKNMTREELVEGHRALFQRIYDPIPFDRRLKAWLMGVEYISPLYKNKKTDLRQFLSLFKLLRHVLFQADAPVRSLFLRNIYWTLRHKPKLMRRTISILAHFRHYYEFAHGAPTKSAECKE
jgi:radical SAM superfamily enzyme YgiQ (UPF0313 family)